MQAFLSELWMILHESALWLIVGLLFAGLVHTLVPQNFLTKHLGTRGPLAVAKASLLGIPMPLCSCAVIPVAASLRDNGAGKGASAAFAISTPQTGEESVPLTWALFGPVYALTRPVVAIVTAFTAGIAINAFTKENDTPSTNDTSKSCCAHTNDGHSHDHDDHTQSKGDVSLNVLQQGPKPGLATKTRETLDYAFGTMLTDLAIWLTLGILAAALVGALVPAEWIETHAGSGLTPKLAMLAVGIPLYICATSSTPLAFSLVAAGLSPGAALVLLLSGPATNAATISWALKDLGVRALIIYLVTIAVFALGAGIAFDAFLANTIVLADTGPSAHEHGASAYTVIKDIAAVLFVVLLAWALGMRANDALSNRGSQEHDHHAHAEHQ